MLFAIIAILCCYCILFFENCVLLRIASCHKTGNCEFYKNSSFHHHILHCILHAAHCKWPPSESALRTAYAATKLKISFILLLLCAVFASICYDCGYLLLLHSFLWESCLLRISSCCWTGCCKFYKNSSFHHHILNIEFSIWSIICCFSISLLARFLCFHAIFIS